MSSVPSGSPETKLKSGGVRQKVLFSLLALLLVALAYDYAVARPNVDTAYDAIIDRSVEINAENTRKFTNRDVQTLVGKQPSRTFQESNGETVEVYSWRSGLPIKTHDLFVVYRKSGEDLMFSRHAKFLYESSSDVSVHSVSKVVEYDENSLIDSTGYYGNEGTMTDSDQGPSGDDRRNGGDGPDAGPTGQTDKEPETEAAPETSADADRNKGVRNECRVVKTQTV